MPFLTEVHFQNYRSFLDAKCRLSPVTVVIGANNAGKSNFLRGIECAGSVLDSLGTLTEELNVSPHREGKKYQKPVSLKFNGGKSTLEIVHRPGGQGRAPQITGQLRLRAINAYELEPDKIGCAEVDTENPFVHRTGEGVTRVLQWMSLKQRKTFAKIEQEFQGFVPEIEELTFERADQGKWFLQVKEKGIGEPVALTDLSKGTRTILALLTILHQERHPDVLLIEDIEVSIHPRGLEPLINIMRQISKDHGVQFIMTTQSPYVLDCFKEKDQCEAIVIVEKKNGVSRLANADVRLEQLGYYRTDPYDRIPLGDLWYSGVMGGVDDPPEFIDDPAILRR